MSTVLFDLDDTLFDHSRALYRAIGTLQRTDPILRTRSLRGLVRRYRRLLEAVVPGLPGMPGTIGEARIERFRRLRIGIGASDDVNVARRWSKEYRRAYQDERRPVPGTIPLLRELHSRVSVGVVTNNQTLEQSGKLRYLGLERWIDFLVTSETAGSSKPDARIFELALYRAGCAADAAVMVGDTWETDILGARAAGVPAVWLNRRRAKRHGLLQGVREIRSLLPTTRVARLLLSGRAGIGP